MPAQSYPYLAFNRGLLSHLGLSRLDIARGRLSAETMTNWMPRVLGSMMLRPGLKYLGAPKDSNSARLIPFVFSKTDRAILEFTVFAMRIWINDVLLTNPATTTTITNGEFTTDLTGWTDNDESGGTSDWVSGTMRLFGDNTNAAIRDQTITVAGGNINLEHALRVVIADGAPVTIRVGTSTTDDSYIAQTELLTGTHQLRFTPTGNFNIRFLNRSRTPGYVNTVSLDSGGNTTLPTPWIAVDLDHLRYDQSGDVIFVAMRSYSPYRIERRGTRSWSVVQYRPEDGPFRVMNTTGVTMTSSALHSESTVTASGPVFKTSHNPSASSPGALFKVASRGQFVQTNISAQNTFTDAIRVIGVDAERIFTYIVSEDAVGAATFTLQRSLESADGPWTDLESYTASVVSGFDDALDNIIAWYRIGVKTGNYVNGTHFVSLSYALGSVTGIFRIKAVSSPTVATVSILKSFGNLSASPDWSEGEWSDRRGWPSAVAFHEARLCWAGKGKLWLSATDAFDVFDEDMEGDAAPISRSIGTGPVDHINWLFSAERLIAGADGAEWSVRSSSLDEPLTPTAFQIKAASNQGSGPVDVIKIDRRGLFVQSGSTRVFEMSMANDPNATDFGVIDLTQVVPEVGQPSIVRAAAQRQPDTRVHLIRSDGVAAVLIFDPTENTICWVHVTTGYPTADVIEDVCVLPSTGSLVDGPEDHVYYVVLRQHNGLNIRTIEKWARESECQGGDINKQADAHVVYDGASTTTITGLTHLNGADVVVWADGTDVGTATSTATSWTQTYEVSGGQITLASAVTKAVVGLPYKAQWKSSKLAIAAALGVPLTKRKRVHGIGVVLADTHAQGLFFGRDFTHLDPLPLMRNEVAVDPDAVLADAEDGAMTFPGEWAVDARICLEGRAPRPVTVCAMVADTELHEAR